MANGNAPSVPHNVAEKDGKDPLSLITNCLLGDRSGLYEVTGFESVGKTSLLLQLFRILSRHGLITTLITPGKPVGILKRAGPVPDLRVLELHRFSDIMNVLSSTRSACRVFALDDAAGLSLVCPQFSLDGFGKVTEVGRNLVAAKNERAVQLSQLDHISRTHKLKIILSLPEGATHLPDTTQFTWSETNFPEVTGRCQASLHMVPLRMRSIDDRRPQLVTLRLKDKGQNSQSECTGVYQLDPETLEFSMLNSGAET